MAPESWEQLIHQNWWIGEARPQRESRLAGVDADADADAVASSSKFRRRQHPKVHGVAHSHRVAPRIERSSGETHLQPICWRSDTLQGNCHNTRASLLTATKPVAASAIDYHAGATSRTCGDSVRHGPCVPSKGAKSRAKQIAKSATSALGSVLLRPVSLSED